MGRVTPIADAQIELPYEAIATVCRDLGVKDLYVFGSVLRDEFTAASDVDFLVEFENNDAGPWMSKFGELEAALSRVLGRAVDVSDYRGILQSRNHIRRNDVLSTARQVYAA